MRIIIQRVLSAGVKVNNEEISNIGKGILILLGLDRNDNEETIKKWAEKCLKLRIWPQYKKIQNNEEENKDDQEEGNWKTCVQDNDFEVLVVSQFTLYAVLKGNKPDFHLSMDAQNAKILYESFINHMKKIYKNDKIKGGKFQEYMHVNLVNDGPVTLQFEDFVEEKKKKSNQKQQQKQNIKADIQDNIQEKEINNLEENQNNLQNK